jgi:hypothetical protein
MERASDLGKKAGLWREPEILIKGKTMERASDLDKKAGLWRE